MTRQRTFRIGIIGGGFGGIAAAVRLIKAGIEPEMITIFESEAAPGGTWHKNRYPGCAVDTHISAYEFTFYPGIWNSSHPPQSELAAYAESIVHHYGLASCFQYQTSVISLTWNEDQNYWRMETTAENVQTFDIVISATGMLSKPHIPAWVPEQPEIPIVHSSEWIDPLNLSESTVSIIGTGSTSAQLVPALATQVRRLNVYQRQAGWVEPREDAEYTPRQRKTHSNPVVRIFNRYRIFARQLLRARGFQGETRQQIRMREKCVAFLRSQVRDPKIRQQLTPHYPWGCKRPVISSKFLKAFNYDNTNLIPQAVEQVTGNQVIDSSGSSTPTDYIILATGFTATEYLAGIEIQGRNGVRLADHWRERPHAYLGVSVPLFPNFFIMYGPNTNGTPTMTAYLDIQAKLIAHLVKRFHTRGYSQVEALPTDTARWLRLVDSAVEKNMAVTMSGCTNYYLHNGVNVTQWPRSLFQYWLQARRARLTGFQFKE